MVLYNIKLAKILKLSKVISFIKADLIKNYFILENDICNYRTEMEIGHITQAYLKNTMLCLIIIKK